LNAWGVVAGKHHFLRYWLRKFIRFAKPREWDQARRDDFEQLLYLLLRDGKKG
jgi:hypothetical protein